MASENKTWNLKDEISSIGAIAGAMLAVFAFFEALTGSSLSSPISAVVVGVVITRVLVQTDRIRLETAAITWLGVAFAIFILFYVISQPATIFGTVVDINGVPIAGLTVMLTDSDGVEHKSVTDEDGYFQIKNVPDGRYIIVSDNGRVFSGEIKSGWQRLFAPEVDTGEHVDLAGISTPIFTPTAPTVTATTTPTDLPRNTHTPTDEVPPTASDTPTTTPTRTPRPTNTPNPPTETQTPSPTITEIPEPLILYEEDFEDDRAQLWHFNTGTWSIVDDGTGNKVLQVNSGNGTTNAQFGPPAFSDGQIEFRLKIIGGAFPPRDALDVVQLGFRNQSAAELGGSWTEYILVYGPEGSNLSLVYQEDGGDWQSLDGAWSSVTIPYSNRDWITFRIEAQGGDIRIYAEGELLFTGYDSRIERGALYLNTGTFVAQFDDFKVWKNPSTDETSSLDASESIQPVTRNADWTPTTREFDGIEMVLVPPGCFMMGTLESDDDTKPIHEQCFEEPFWIDKYEVTNMLYNLCVEVGGCTEAQPTDDSFRDSQPAANITWFQAKDYCEWRGGRLPTEREWEYAARGPDGLVYPWGDEWNPENAVWSTRQAENVGSIPAGVSWVGAFDMSGNMWEPVSSLRMPYPYDPNDGREDTTNSQEKHFLRGGSWADSWGGEEVAADILTSFGRGDEVAPDGISSNFGIRCARNY